MKTATIAIAALIVLAGVGFVIFNKDDSSGSDDNQAQTSQQQESVDSSESQASNESANSPDPNNYTEGADIGETVDATDQKEVTVSIDDFIFETTYLKIKKGTKVTWVNNGNIGHTVTSDEGSPNGGLDSTMLGSGDTYEFTFEQAGIYEYFCVPHPAQMRGVITVVD